MLLKASSCLFFLWLHIGDGWSICRRWIFLLFFLSPPPKMWAWSSFLWYLLLAFLLSFFFFFLSPPIKMTTRSFLLLMFQIQSLFFWFLIFTFDPFMMFYLFSISLFNFNLSYITVFFFNFVLILLISKFFNLSSCKSFICF